MVSLFYSAGSMSLSVVTTKANDQITKEPDFYQHCKAKCVSEPRPRRRNPVRLTAPPVCYGCYQYGCYQQQSRDNDGTGGDRAC